jgi:hypothetical protein
MNKYCAGERVYFKAEVAVIDYCLYKNNNSEMAFLTSKIVLLFSGIDVE